MKKSLLLLLAAFATLAASAQTKVEIDGIWYNLTSETQQAEVTFKGSSYDEYSEMYSGSINIPATVTYEGVDYSVTSIGEYTFFYCTHLTAITIPEGVTSIGSGAFQSCSRLTAINIPENSKLTSIGDYAVTTCRSLASITIPESVTSIGSGAFSHCSSLTAINIPENSQLTSIGENAFYSCSSLTAINIPESVTSIGGGAFHDCSSLTAITIPEGVTSIEWGAFSHCSSLASITIPEGVTSIGNYAFSGCSSLTAVVLPKNLEGIHLEAFANCSMLLDVYCYAEAEEMPWAEYDAFDGSYPENVTLHVPANALNAYKSTAPWDSFGTIVELGAAITGITLDKTSATLTEGEELTLEITTTPDDADRNLISWNSSNPSVATVDNTGKITAVAPGTATITATAYDDSGVSASCEVIVLAQPSYTITYLVDGEVHHRDTLTRGSAIEPIENPIKEGHTFSGWSEVPETMPAHDVTVNGRFTVNKYVVTFKVGDEVIAADTLEYGAAIVAPEAPEKEEHTFCGWSEIPETMPAHDVTVNAIFTVNKYVVTFKVGDEVIAANTLEYGAAIVAPEAPEKEGHTFSGWSEIPETMPAYDVTVNGRFTVNKYVVTFKVGDEVIVADTLEYGAAIVAPEAPEKEGHTFNGWSEIPETMPAHDVTVKGRFTVNKYVVIFKVGDKVIASGSLEYNATIVAPEVPEKEGYTFSGWGDVAKTVPAYDVTYEGTYTINIYKVYYYVGAELVNTIEVAYGDSLPEYIYEPTEEDDIFCGWVGETYDTMPAHDVAYTANIENGIENLSADKSQKVIYNLQGHRVTQPTKGIYIVNGKKVVIK